MASFSFFLLSILVASSVADIKFESCGGSAATLDKLVLGTNGKIKLAPLSKINVEYKLNVNVPLPSAVDVKIDVTRKVLWSDISMCSFLNGLCNERRVTCAEIQKLSQNAPPSMQGPCPLPQGIHTKAIVVDLPQDFDAGTIGRMLGSGTYKIKVEIKSNNQMLACGSVSGLEIEV